VVIAQRNLRYKKLNWGFLVLFFFFFFGAAITACHKLGDYNEHKFIGSQFWRLGSPGWKGWLLVSDLSQPHPKEKSGRANMGGTHLL
jgi:hypothetical protein